MPLFRWVSCYVGELAEWIRLNTWCGCWELGRCARVVDHTQHSLRERGD